LDETFESGFDDAEEAGAEKEEPEARDEPETKGEEDAAAEETPVEEDDEDAFSVFDN
jgi:hypothetical protein